MSDLSLHIVELDGELFVDSRLVAAKLDIEHETFVRTIRKYQGVIEPRFGIIRFQIGEIVGKGQPEQFAMLNENQATVLMTFSRNTPVVVQCKLDLVSAFSEAKKLLAKTVAPQPAALPSRELALETARSVSEIKDLLGDTDPRLCQMLVDVAINDAIQTIKAIAPASETTWMGVSEIAESLKLPVTMQNRASLGKFVKALCGELGKQESRLCNGRMTPVWCYPMPNTEVESAVRKFFN